MIWRDGEDDSSSFNGNIQLEEGDENEDLSWGDNLLIKPKQKGSNNSLSNLSNMGRESFYINKDIMNLLDDDEETTKKPKRKKSPNHTYSKTRWLDKCNETIKLGMKLNWSSSVHLASTPKQFASPKIRQNFVWKEGMLNEARFRTSTTTANEHPLVNYYKTNHNLNTSARMLSEGGRTPSIDNDITEKLFNKMNIGNVVDDLVFNFPDDNKGFDTNNSGIMATGDFSGNFFANKQQSRGSISGALNMNNNINININNNNDMKGNVVIGPDGGNDFLPLYFFDKNELNSTNSSKAWKVKTEIGDKGVNEHIKGEKWNSSFSNTKTTPPIKESKFAFVTGSPSWNQAAQDNSVSKNNSQQFISNVNNSPSNRNNYGSAGPAVSKHQQHQQSQVQSNFMKSQNNNIFIPNDNRINQTENIAMAQIGSTFNQQDYLQQDCNNIMLQLNTNLPQDISQKNKQKQVQVQVSSVNQPNPNLNFNEYTAEELIKYANIIVNEQNGCRFIQKKIETNPEISNKIFDSLEKDLLTLTCGLFGNYLLQRLLCEIDYTRLNRYIDIVTPFFINIAVSPHGTRVIQKMIEIIKDHPSLVDKITQFITVNILTLTVDSNSNHIIQKYVTDIHHPFNQPVYDKVVEHFLLISKDKFGCCMIQKCIECGTNEQQHTLIQLTLNYAKIWITEQYGNYDLQYIVKLGNQEINAYIINNIIITDLKSYFTQKFSSNVIEKLWEHSSQDWQNIIIKSMVQNENFICEMLLDSYGNYIVQKILLIAMGKVYYNWLSIIGRNANQLMHIPFGNRVLTKLLAQHKDLRFMINSNNNKNNNNNNNNNGNINNSMNHPGGMLGGGGGGGHALNNYNMNNTFQYQSPQQQGQMMNNMNYNNYQNTNIPSSQNNPNLNPNQMNNNDHNNIMAFKGRRGGANTHNSHGNPNNNSNINLNINHNLNLNVNNINLPNNQSNKPGKKQSLNSYMQ